MTIGVGRRATLALGATVALLACAVPAAPLANGPAPAVESSHPPRMDFAVFRARLAKARAATVTTACGTTVAPWAYRGAHAAGRALGASHAAEADVKWTARFVAALDWPAEWDSVTACVGADRPCDTLNATPLVVVALHGHEDLYVMFTFETRCATVFEVERPLGALRLGTRADSVFALVREAMPREARMDSLPAEVPARAARSAPPRDSLLAMWSPDVESLPYAEVKVPPSYPQAAIARAVDGTVQVQALVGRDGAVHDAFILHSIPGLNDAALDAVWQWRFRPARDHGEPLAVWVVIPVRFALH